MNLFNPLPTIKSILGMSSDKALAETFALARLDSFDPPQCESEDHNTNPKRHAGLAVFLIILPCGHNLGYRCATYSSWLQHAQLSCCPKCGRVSDSFDLDFIPIGGTR